MNVRFIKSIYKGIFYLVFMGAVILGVWAIYLGLQMIFDAVCQMLF